MTWHPNVCALGITSGRAYVNIQSTSFAAGEISGFLQLASGLLADVVACNVVIGHIALKFSMADLSPAFGSVCWDGLA